MASKYSSIEESFIGDELYNVQLNSLATPPADLAVNGNLFNTVSMYGGISGGPTGRFGKFDHRDKPIVRGLALFCNIADGLVLNDNPANSVTGLALKFTFNRYNAVNAVLGGAGAYPTGAFISYKFPELNFVYPVDIPLDVSNVLTTDDHLRIDVNGVNLTGNFAMITVNPLFATKRLIFYPYLFVEHTYPILGSSF
jgi:hypothetical protein